MSDEIEYEPNSAGIITVVPQNLREQITAEVREELRKDNAIATLVLKELLGDVRDWAKTASAIRSAMNGPIIALKTLSDETEAELIGQERILYKLAEEIEERMKNANVNF